MLSLYNTYCHHLEQLMWKLVNMSLLPALTRDASAWITYYMYGEVREREVTMMPEWILSSLTETFLGYFPLSFLWVHYHSHHTLLPKALHPGVPWWSAAGQSPIWLSSSCTGLPCFLCVALASWMRERGETECQLAIVTDHGTHKLRNTTMHE